MSMRYNELSELLYHGSASSFTEIDLSYSAPNKDYGQGFYTTNSLVQAEKFARLKARRTGNSQGYVEVFNFKGAHDLRVLYFEAADDAWLDFILGNRGFQSLRLTNRAFDFDIAIGPVANDAVGTVLNQFTAGAFGNPLDMESRATAIRLLASQVLHNQVFFKTAQAVDRLSFIEVHDVPVD